MHGLKICLRKGPCKPGSEMLKHSPGYSILAACCHLTLKLGKYWFNLTFWRKKKEVAFIIKTQLARRKILHNYWRQNFAFQLSDLFFGFFFFPCSNTPSIWSPAHALAWHLGEDFRNKPAAWATAKCIEWDREEEKLPNFMEEIIDCPCTLAQARADTGRFHVSY